jgi:hypothetical protein
MASLMSGSGGGAVGSKRRGQREQPRREEDFVQGEKRASQVAGLCVAQDVFTPGTLSARCEGVSQATQALQQGRACSVERAAKAPEQIAQQQRGGEAEPE